jgi:hypothetical protein
MAKKKADNKKILGSFEGADVIGTALILRNTGDGLSDSMEIAPVNLHVGDLIEFVGRAEVVGVRHDSASKETSDLTRVHIARANLITLIESEEVDRLLDEHSVAIEKAKGVERLPFDTDEPGMTLPEPTPIDALAKEAARKAKMAARKAAQKADDDG